jgi:hypothetical protein
MIKRVIASVLLYAVATLGAFVATGLLHIFSGRALWGVFPEAVRVRQLSIYLLDVIPFFLVALIVIASVGRFYMKRDIGRFSHLLLMTSAAAAAAIVLHVWFFYTDWRGVVFLTLFSILFAGFYCVAGWLAFGWFRPFRGFVGFPAPNQGMRAFVCLIVVSIVYVGAFKSGHVPGFRPEQETYRAELEPSPSRTIYAPGPDGDPLGVKLFTQEELPVGPGTIHFGDVDGDGWIDAVLRRSNATLELWRNDKGTFVRQDDFLSGVRNQDIADFYVVDYDGDGRSDIVVGYINRPQPSEFHNTVVKKLFWYPFNDSALHLGLLRQVEPGRWEDTTQFAFPDGVPLGFQKIEPLLWFDANGDGRLDFVFSQYPNGRSSLNKLYVQDSSGQFHDRMHELLKGASNWIYSEGGDVADYDGDGDIDFFAYGYLWQRDGLTYRARCGKAMEGFPCHASGRNEEAGLFVDINGDGAFDFVTSYHGPGGKMPKYQMQIFMADGANPGGLVRAPQYGQTFYGMNTYARAADFNLDGIPDILVDTPGRLITLRDGAWVDLLPAISKLPSGAMAMGGWIDIDDDGDWDFIASSVQTGRQYLYRNNLDPKRIVKIAARGESGVENQMGATIQIRGDGKKLVEAYRPIAGYAGTMDPRIVVQFVPGQVYSLRACFASLSGTPSYTNDADGVHLRATGVAGNCLTYELMLDDTVSRVDLTLIAGPQGAAYSVR